ncbi:MarR family winged helix-turn-helix transcriptional regulator [Breznakiella homolactica]|uniref:MarR family transcriptional regulator n=1 Tax=Breznakiella homolactica TaxID=2798577 RepID=A0A7T7XLJ5_9SPIR|nr:MarR family transcriptional regulator [Breznakiella homolactica]QQO08428.1 MarR family transcriptional regulator [Breznakiella homolactica]
MRGYAEKIYVLVHRCHEQCLKLMRAKNQPAKELRETGINTRQGIILKILLSEDGLTQKELTSRLEITSSSCGELITKLEQAGYLERRSSPADKRTFNVYLTDSGRILAKQYKKTCVVELEEWASDLTEREKEQLFHLLGKLSKGLNDRISKGSGRKS